MGTGRPRTWTDADLQAAIEVAQNWTEVVVRLGLKDLTCTRQRIKVYALGLGLQKLQHLPAKRSKSDTSKSSFCCLSCGGYFTTGLSVKRSYCSTKCQMRLKSERAVTNWLNGGIGYSGITVQLKPSVRRYILKQANYTCAMCGWAERHPTDGKPLVEVDHIDGDATNCRPDNLRVLCPNHHAMTETFRARNRNSKRNRQAPLA